MTPRTAHPPGSLYAAQWEERANQQRVLIEELAESRRRIAAVERRALRQLLENWDGPFVAMAEGAMAEIARLRKRLAELLPAGR